MGAAAVLLALVFANSAVTGWLLAQHVAMRRTVAQLGELVQLQGHDLDLLDAMLRRGGESG